MQSLVYTGFQFIQGLVYTGFQFIQGLVYTGFQFIQGMVYTGFTVPLIKRQFSKRLLSLRVNVLFLM